jgi:UDP-glucose 4-epimerase
MRCLVTGGAGFIGSHLANALLAEGHDVIVLDDLSTGSLDNLRCAREHDGLEFVEGSVLDPATVDSCLASVEACFHLASVVGVALVMSDPVNAVRQMTRGDDLVISAAARLRRRLVFASSSEVYGPNASGTVSENDNLSSGPPSKPRWCYAIAKLAGEALACAHSYNGRSDMICARLFNAVGARQSGQYGMVLPSFVRHALDGGSLQVHGDGAQTRCFTHVLDTVNALVARDHGFLLGSDHRNSPPWLGVS